MKTIENINNEYINKITENDIFARQLLKPFLNIDNQELTMQLQELSDYLKNIEIDYEIISKKIKESATNVDDNLLKRISTEDYILFKDENYGKIEDELYIFNEEIVLCCINLSSEKSDYVLMNVDSDSIRNIKELLNTNFVYKYKMILFGLKKYNNYIPDYVIEYANKNMYSQNDRVECYIWSEKQGIKLSESYYHLGLLYANDGILKDTEKAIRLLESAGIRESNIELAKLFARKNEYTKAINYAEKAKDDFLVNQCKNELLELNKEKEAKRVKENIIKDYVDKYIRITKKNCIKLNIRSESSDDNPIKSKLGGNPYMPFIEEWPKDKSGDYMPLLIQINFSDFISDKFPKTGLLQIFVDKELSYPAEYSIKYYNDLSKESIKEYPKIDLSHFVLDKCYSIEFSDSEVFMPISDYRANDIINSMVNEILTNKEKLEKLKETEGIENNEKNQIIDLLYDQLYDENNQAQITLGGYADFTQTDPRVYEKDKNKLTECLFKMDSCGEVEFNIGDSGIISVLISEDDLKNCRFDKAILDWDCC